jgi:hypothetical protein
MGLRRSRAERGDRRPRGWAGEDREDAEGRDRRHAESSEDAAPGPSGARAPGEPPAREGLGGVDQRPRDAADVGVDVPADDGYEHDGVGQPSTSPPASYLAAARTAGHEAGMRLEDYVGEVTARIATVK